MKPIVRRGLGLLTVIAFFTIWAVSASMAKKSLRVRTCSGKETLEVTVTDSASRRFVEKEDVEKWLDDEYRAYAGLRLDSVDLDRIEKTILAHSAVKTCEAWLTDDGTLHVELSQREPVLRFDNGSNGYYSDADGFIFPLQSRFTVDAPVVEGKIPMNISRGFKGAPESAPERAWLEKILLLCRQMDGSLWKDHIRRIAVEQSGDLVLYPVQGKERFIFGPPVRIEEKLSLMEKYYTTVRPSKEPGYYSTVDLRYRQQLICRQ
ncbi:MAG: hypothetical protein J5835_05485 [Bacteroidales bacterium]|nr:hypothetical protein [Bacteroidales bacterium]